ncbi:MAG: spore coat protein U domain-containing protein [Limnohabitans sp.]|nr:spore coat protein U domain-containing protein [Limnohabitans sp.]
MNPRVQHPEWAGRHGGAKRWPGWVGVLATLLATGGAVHPRLACAATVLDGVQVHCTLQSTRIHFGTLNLHGMRQVSGQGEVLVSCENPSSTVQVVDLTVSPTAVGQDTVTLEPRQGGLVAHFFLDEPRTVPWGDGRNGTRALHTRARLDPGAHQWLRLPLYALLHKRPEAPAALYELNIPLTLTLSPP